jgi:hypothetical protein
MSKAIELVRKFMLEYVPTDAQIPVNDLFQGLSRDVPATTYGALMYNRATYLHEGVAKDVQVALVNGMVAGVALAHGIDDEGVQRMIKGYLDSASKSRGENVVKFLERKGQ